MNKSTRFSPDTIPNEMRDKVQWCVYGRRGEKGIDALTEDGKLEKIPCNPVNGKNASSNKPETWATFDEAVTVYNHGMFNGVGYFFNYANDGMAGIDIDHKFVDGQPDDDTQQIIEHFPDTYIELSPSGDGLHIYALGMPLHCGKGEKNKWLEIYGRDVQGKSSNRYFCVTGNVFENAPATIADGQKGLAWLHETYKKAESKKIVNKKSSPRPHKNSTTSISPLEKYVHAAFDNQIANVQSASDGSRNDDLYKAAVTLKEFANSDWAAPFISESDIESALIAATSLPEKEARSTIASAFKKAGSSCRDIPPQNKSYVTPLPANQNKANEVGWESRLRRNKDGGVVNTKPNIRDILLYHPQWRGVLARNEFTGHINKLKVPPYPNSPNNGLGEWTDIDNELLSLWFADNYGLEIDIKRLQGLVVAVSVQNKVNPVHKYLEYCYEKWLKAGKPSGYATRWVEKHLGAKESPASRMFQKAWVISAVARVYNPGCKVDNVLILEGNQGFLKSTALSVLGGEWFSDTPIDFSGKDSLMLIHENWIIEMPELDQFKKSDADKAKSFFARNEDKYRAPYGHNLLTVKRQCVFAGTTNTEDYLKDATGNRRYMPIKCHKKCNLKALKAERDLIWGEAVSMYKSGEKWWYDDTLEYIQDAQNERFAEDVWHEEIESFVGLYPTGVTIQMVLVDALKMDLDKAGKFDRNRVADVLRKMGWKQSTRVMIAGKYKRGWKR